MVSKEDVLPITRQCELLDLARSTYYYMPEPVSDEELALMKRKRQRNRVFGVST